MLSLFGSGRESNSPSVLVVVGVHREERAFGEAVAERLPRDRFDLLRIEQGLCNRRPGPHEHDAYRARHRALYAQILEHIQPGHRVVLDLHTGLDEAGPSADVLCADPGLLRCVEPGGGDGSGQAGSVGLPVGKVRGVQLVGDEPASCGIQAAEVSTDPACSGRWPRLRPDIPRAVWCAGPHLYAGIEVYLSTAGDALDTDVAFGAAVVLTAAACGLRRAATIERTIDR